MRPLFPIENLYNRNYKTNDLLPLECERCGSTFYVKVKWIRQSVKRKDNEHQFCGRKCSREAQITQVIENCGQCSKSVMRVLSQKLKSKSGHIFCSHKCAATYSNKHKTVGTRRSKLEQWLETKLIVLYPDLKLIFNGKETINSELDIYIPSLQLAIELNGIYHYEPIHGAEKLASIKNNDDRKFQACLERGIELVIIDTSREKQFKETKSQKYLDIITKIVDLRLNKNE